MTQGWKSEPSSDALARVWERSSGLDGATDRHTHEAAPSPPGRPFAGLTKVSAHVSSPSPSKSRAYANHLALTPPIPAPEDPAGPVAHRPSN